MESILMLCALGLIGAALATEPGAGGSVETGDPGTASTGEEPSAAAAGGAGEADGGKPESPAGEDADSPVLTTRLKESLRAVSRERTKYKKALEAKTAAEAEKPARKPVEPSSSGMKDGGEYHESLVGYEFDPADKKVLIGDDWISADLAVSALSGRQALEMIQGMQKSQAEADAADDRAKLANKIGESFRSDLREACTEKFKDLANKPALFDRAVRAVQQTVFEALDAQGFDLSDPYALEEGFADAVGAAIKAGITAEQAYLAGVVGVQTEANDEAARLGVLGAGGITAGKAPTEYADKSEEQRFAGTVGIVERAMGLLGRRR